jgi:pimeloyl-ACP methyl ester carboxylesterase
MSDVTVAAAVLNCLKTIAKKIGWTVRDTVGSVNPDVWREAAFVSASAYSLFIPRREDVVDRAPDGGLPIVLVHGLGGNRGAWTPLRLFLRLHGRRRIFAFGFEEGTLEKIAADLKQFVETVQRVCGEAQVDIVAHSLGGLAARYAIQRLGMAPAVRTLITLATPHRGTYAAHYANTPLTLVLRPESPVLQDLNADDFSQTGIRFTSIGSDRDVYVVPKEMTVHPAAENVFVPGISHSQHLVAPRVFREVLARLTPVRE